MIAEQPCVCVCVSLSLPVSDTETLSVNRGGVVESRAQNLQLCSFIGTDCDTWHASLRRSLEDEENG